MRKQSSPHHGVPRDVPPERLRRPQVRRTHRHVSVDVLIAPLSPREVAQIMSHLGPQAVANQHHRRLPVGLVEPLDRGHRPCEVGVAPLELGRREAPVVRCRVEVHAVFVADLVESLDDRAEDVRDQLGEGVVRRQVVHAGEPVHGAHGDAGTFGGLVRIEAEMCVCCGFIWFGMTREG